MCNKIINLSIDFYLFFSFNMFVYALFLQKKVELLRIKEETRGFRGQTVKVGIDSCSTCPLNCKIISII